MRNENDFNSLEVGKDAMNWIIDKAEKRGHLDLTKKAGIGAGIGAVCGSFLGPVGAIGGAAIGSAVGSFFSEDDE